MKTSFTKRAATFCATLLLCFFATGSLFAQITNDDVCNAIDVPDDGIGILIEIDSAEATIEMGEDAITPPLSTGCDPHTICDGGIEASVWFKFTAPTSGAVNITLCGSDFDTQLALYAVTDCADFGTFTFMDASDDTNEAIGGAPCGPSSPTTAFPDYGLSSELNPECLTPGQVYYVLVDEWSTGGITSGGVVDIKISEVTPSSVGVVIDSIDVSAPLCPGGADGTATAVFDGIFPYTIVWDNGATTETNSGLTAGPVSVTITDFCGTAAVGTGMVPAASAPIPVSLGDITALDAYCKMGYINLDIVAGTPPFDIVWSNGETTPFIWAEKGTYTVSVTDACDAATVVETIDVDGVADAGIDITVVEADCENSSSVIGGTPPASGGVVIDNSTLTYSLDQTIGGGVACRGGGFISDNGFLRAFDLAGDFGITTDYTLDEIEITFLSAIAGDGSGYQPVEMRIFEVDNAELSTATLTPVDTIRVNLPDLAAETYWSFPTNYTIPANQIIAVEVWNPNGTAVGNSLVVGVNQSATLNNVPTYIRSEGCGITAPTKFADIGFDDEMVVNLVSYSAYAGNYTYSWTPTTGLDDAALGNPTVTYDSMTMAPITTYTLAVTDDNGCVTESQVIYDATACAPAVSVIDIINGTYAIAPNPSSGLFTIQNEGITREMNMQVFDIQGKMITSKMLNLAQGDSETLNLTDMPKGMYIVKMTSGNEAEIHKLIVQ